jgi:hypothetical protein
MDYSLLLAVHKRRLGGSGGWDHVIRKYTPMSTAYKSFKRRQKEAVDKPDFGFKKKKGEGKREGERESFIF